MTGRSDKHERIGVDADRQVLSVPHLGFTLRSLLGAAASAGPVTEENSQWTLRYRSVDIGAIRLKVYKDEPS